MYVLIYVYEYVVLLYVVLFAALLWKLRRRRVRVKMISYRLKAVGPSPLVALIDAFSSPFGEISWNVVPQGKFYVRRSVCTMVRAHPGTGPRSG